MELDIPKIKALIKDSHLRQRFCNQLELIILVDLNFEHIVQLEQLISLFKSGLGDYYKQYHPDQEYLTLQAGIIAENTRYNHYHKGEKLDVHSLFEDLIGRKSNITDFKSQKILS